MKTTTTTHPATLGFLAALFFFFLLAPMAAGQDSQDTYWQNNLGGVDKIANDKGGDGTEGNPILIATAKELAYFAKQVNAGEALAVSNNVASGSIKNEGEHKDFQGYYFALSANIDLEEHYWTPIGTKNNPFYGNFDGNGYCVTGLKVKIEDFGDVYAGLFGHTGFGTLRNLGISLAEDGILGKSTGGNVEAGALAGRAKNISNCYVVGDGIVEAQGTSLSSAGGIVGYLTNTLTHCYATVGVKATGASMNNYAGGIAAQCGSASCNLSYTYATGAVKAAGVPNYAGGICGDGGEGTLSNNLALNTSIIGNRENSHRIVGNNKNATLSSNYASTNIDLNGSTDITADITASLRNGADTWLETFKDDLIPDPEDTDNGWLAAWEWPDAGSDNLPKLKKVKGDENSFTYDTFLTKQPDIINTNVLTKSKYSPFILGAHIASFDPVYLAYDYGKKQWLRSVQGGNNTTPTFPFNGTMKGADAGALNPIIIRSLSGVSGASYVSNEAPTLFFENVILISDEKPSLTVNKDVKVILKMSSDKNSAVNSDETAGIPVIANDGTLTIKTEKSSSLTVISANNYAIKNSGTLILDGNGIILGGKGPAIYNDVNAKANVIYNSPMVEWQFASGLSHKVIRWSNTEIELRKGHDNCRSLATTYVPPVGQSLGLEVASAEPDSPYITQQGCDDDGNYTTEFTAQDGKLTVYTDVKDYTPPAPDPVPIYYSVYLPQVEGVTTNPGPGMHEVESWDNFRFYLTLDSAYSQSQPIVTTDRGETLQPRTSDGAYLVKYVRSDVEVFIDGIVQNPPPVANEAIAPTDALAPQIWAEGSMLCIRMVEALPSAPVRIFTVDGRLHDRFASTPGLNRRQLPTGMYIVRIGETVRKVVVGR